MQTADAVIIGGGVMGTSIAYYLAAGGTGKSTALVRQHYDNYPESKMVFESWKVFYNWAELIGGDCGFVQSGFVRTVIPAETNNLIENVRMQKEIGTHTVLVSAQELREICPYWYADD